MLDAVVSRITLIRKTIFELSELNIRESGCRGSGEVTEPDGAMWYLTCEGRQIGVGVRARYDKDKDRVWVTQLGF